MGQAITDYGTFLMEAKQAVTDLRDMEQRETALSSQLKQSRRAAHFTVPQKGGRIFVQNWDGIVIHLADIIGKIPFLYCHQLLVFLGINNGR